MISFQTKIVKKGQACFSELGGLSCAANKYNVIQQYFSFFGQRCEFHINMRMVRKSLQKFKTRWGALWQKKNY